MPGDVRDVAQFIIEQFGPGLTAKQLQKLCYYSKAWSLAIRNDPLFPQDFEAWRDGPVSRVLYSCHAGEYSIRSNARFGDASRLSDAARRLVCAVLESYRGLSGDELGDLTHQEDPWKNARANLGPDESGEAVIPEKAMKRYYAKQQLQGRSPTPIMKVAAPDWTGQPFETVLGEQLERWAGVNRLLADR